MVAAGFANTGYLGLPFSAALFGLDELSNAVAYDVVVTTLGDLHDRLRRSAPRSATAGDRPRERAGGVLRPQPAAVGVRGWASSPRTALAPEWAVDASQMRCSRCCRWASSWWA